MIDPFLQAVDRLAHDAVLAPLHARHVDAHLAGGETVLGAAARHMSGASAGDQRLGGNAAGVDAGAAEHLALDDRGLQAFLVEARAERRRRLADADDDRIEAFGHGVFLKTSRRLFYIRPTMSMLSIA